ncbi:MAG: hypothetical protein ACHQFX_13280, partial [Chitinophagales bacterium]
MKTKFFIAIALSVATTNIVPLKAIGQKFVHPGIDQTAADLAQMKKLVTRGEQPWKAAFDRLKSAVDTNFVFK